MKVALPWILVLGLLGCGVVRASGSGGAADGGGTDATACSSDSDCPTSDPVCDQSSGTCRGCTSHNECANAPGRDLCNTGSGECVACLEDAHCSSSFSTICDMDEHVCRGCVDNSECGMGICDIDRATCVAPSDIVWVEASSSTPDAGCGSRVAPCKTVEAGATKAADKTTPTRYMVILPGQAYDETVTVALPANLYVSAVGARFRFQVAPTEQTRFSVSDGPVAWRGGQFDALGFDLGFLSPRAFDVSASGALRIFDTSFDNLETAFVGGEAELEIYDCEFTDGYGAINTAQQRLRVERSRFVDINGKVITASGDVALHSNLFFNNNSAGQQTGLVSLSPNTGQNAIVSFNTFYGNTTTLAQDGVVSCEGTGSTYIVSNIAWELDNVPFKCGGTILHNILGINGGDPLLADGANSNTNPAFNNPGIGDFSLTPGSPAVDSGDALFAPSSDIEGRPRSLGLGPDTGAYEL